MNRNPLYILLVLLLSSCSGVVKKPEALEIKKVAIVSLYSNQSVYNVGKDGGGALNFISFPTFSSHKPPSDSALLIPEMGSYKLVTYSLYTFEEELGKIKGWQIVPTVKVVNALAFKSFALKFSPDASRVIASDTSSLSLKWQTPRGMPPVTTADIKEHKELFLKEINKMSEELDLDAVIVIQLDFAYAPDHSTPDGKEDVTDAYASVATSIKVINRRGTLAIVTPDASSESGERFISDGRASFVGKQMIFNDEVENLFKNAIQKCAVNLRDKINKEL
ncbi:MAG: hypothetical protein SGJ18_15355 [Pseudomonadota bacterium]|nr:hypothetical protein [Pseudomonadota bacterium]